jgi:iron complex transport system substrate-binding protein
MRHTLLSLFTALTLPLALVACGGDTEEPDASGTTAAAADVFPVTVEHAFGTTTIESKPERIATVAWANHEVPLALGVVPVGMSEASWGDDDGDGVLPWVEEKLEELDAETPALFDETDGIAFEAVAATQPDLILATYSGLTETEYETLSKIAPVVAYPDIAWATTVQDMITMSSTAMGMADEGEELVAGLDAQV